MNDNYGNSVAVPITELTTQKTDLAFPEAAINREYKIGSFSYPATTESNGTITYSSSNENVAMVDNTGKVTIRGMGMARITATITKGDGYYQGEASYTASHTLGDGTVTYSFSNPNVATVDNNGKVKILNAGYTIITAEASETETYARTTASYTLNVNKIEQTIAFAESTVNKKYTDKSYTMTATLTKGDGTISYRSTDEGVATVDNSGKVTVRGVGTTTIIATAGVTDNYLSTSTSYSLNVTKGEQVLANESENNDPITVFDTVQSFHLDVQHEVGDGNLSYSSSNEEVATIDEEALVTIVAPGTTTLTVVAEETDLYLRQVYSRVLEVESTPSPITSTT